MRKLVTAHGNEWTPGVQTASHSMCMFFQFNDGMVTPVMSLIGQCYGVYNMSW